MGTLGDLLVLGEGPSVVADADVDLLGRACELLWSRAVAATGVGPHVIKLSVTAAVVRGLRLSLRREMYRLASAHGDRGARLGGSDLFYLAVNHYLHAEHGREFRLPLGELPIVRRNQRGGVVARSPIGLGSLHSIGGVLKSKNQTLIFGPMCIENAKEIPTFRTNFSNFPWQLLGACRPAGFSCLKLVAVCSGCAVY